MLRAVEKRGWCKEAFGVHTVHTADDAYAVLTLQTVHTVRTVHTAHTVHTVHTVHTLLLWSARATTKITLAAPRHPLADPVGWGVRERGGLTKRSIV